jgi:elongation factor Ts
MTQITASLIKSLRDSTGAGMMDCKKALNECAGDIEEATDWLRKKGIGKADKKAGRTAAEGLIAIAKDGNKAAIIEFNSETDFLAKGEKFQAFTDRLAQVALKVDGDFDTLIAAKCPDTGKDTQEIIKESVGEFGENVTLRRSALQTVENGVIATYLHNSVSDTLGKIGVLVALESTGDAAKVEALGRKIAMHIAAAKPTALTRDEVDADALERERNIFKDQAIASGKPEAIAEKMVVGRINKFYGEVVLPEQAFVMDNKMTVAEAIAAEAKEIGAEVTLKGYTLFVLGDGIEKEEDNFAEEVARAVAG